MYDTLRYRTTLGGTPLGGGPARRGDLCLAAHGTRRGRASMPPVGFEPTVLVGERPRTHALDRAATGIGTIVFTQSNYVIRRGRKSCCLFVRVIWNIIILCCCITSTISKYLFKASHFIM